ncbi:MAG: TonB-dependent receptor [Marinilabiliaceae bacterium]|nr:TonB-dependent receptor [Marinilabiliaceae bacterium]
MRYRSFLTLLGISLILSVKALAQEKISQDVKVVRAYTPTVSDAYKVNYMPVLDDTTTSYLAFNYRILSKSVVTDYKPQPITAARLKDKRSMHLQSSYLKAGIGNYGSVVGELGYNVLQSEPFLLGLNIGHNSSFGELKLEDESVVDAPFHDTWADVDFKHFFDDKTFSAGLSFQHNVYSYYGYQTLNEESQYTISDYVNPIAGTDMMIDDRQRLSMVDLRLAFRNNISDELKTSYDFGFGFNSFGNVTGVKQNGFEITGFVLHPVNDLKFGLDLKIASFKTSVPDSIGPMFYFDDRGSTLISANPAVHFDFDKATLKVGMLIGGLIDTEGDEFYVAPDVRGELNVVEGIVSLYGGVNGKIKMNDYQTVSYENPFVSPDANVKTAFHGINLLAGIEGNFSSKTSFSAGIEYSFFSDEHFYVNRDYEANEVSVNPVYHQSNLFKPDYDDGQLLKVKGEMLFRPKKSAEILIHGAYYGWSLDELNEAWHKPEFEFGVQGQYFMFANLRLDAGISYLGERFAYDQMLDGQVKKLDGVVDLNLGGEFYFNKKWTFWANLNNIAASKYYKWNGYPMQGLNVRAGMIFSF